MTPLPDVLGRKILSFTPQTSHAQVSKTFAAWTKKAIEQEWRAVASNPLLAKQVAAIHDPVPFCFQKLFKEQREAFLTSTCYDKFVAEQSAFAGSYSRARFEKGAALLVEEAQEQDRNLEKALHGNRPLSGIASILGLNPRAPGYPQTATEIRAYLDAPGNQAAINQVGQLQLGHLELTGIPPEVAKFSGLVEVMLQGNKIRNIPKEILNLRDLKLLYLYDNRFDHIPEILMRKNDLLTSLYHNPITVFSEEMYDHYFSLDNWLGKSFSNGEQFACFGYAYLFGFQKLSQHDYGNEYIHLSKGQLTEIPFASWLRDKLLIPNLMMLLGKNAEYDLKWMPDCLKWTLIFGCLGISMILAPPLWLLNQTLSLVVVPIVTKVRELLGWGRMIKLD